eukprot:4889670-Amphidinium_carterae.1
MCICLQREAQSCPVKSGHQARVPPNMRVRQIEVLRRKKRRVRCLAGSDFPGRTRPANYTGL